MIGNQIGSHVRHQSHARVIIRLKMWFILKRDGMQLNAFQK